MEADEVLAGLDPEQREVAEATRGPVCVLAGAGTGKTRAITHRIAYAVLSGVVAPQRVLAVTFTTRAAGELRGRLRGLGAPGVQAKTFHAAAYKQLHYFWPKVIGGEPPRLVESKLALVAEAARVCRLSCGRTELRDAASEVEWAKVTQTRPDEYAVSAVKAGRTPPVDAADMGRLYDDVRADPPRPQPPRLRGHAGAHRGDLHRAPGGREHSSATSTATSSSTNTRTSTRCRSSCSTPGSASATTCASSATRTRRSTPSPAPARRTSSTSPWSTPDATVVKLVRDYRSTPQVVGLANGVLEQAKGETRGHRLELIAQRGNGPAPAFHEYDDEVAEAEGVARRIRELVDEGVPAREIAVLFRINAQSEPYEQAFADAGLPYVVKGAERFFERAEVRQAVVLLRGAARRSTRASRSYAPCASVLSSAGLTEQAPDGRGAARERWESLAALAQLAEDVAADNPKAGLREFVAELEERAAAQHAPTLEGVTLATLHAAKGLEWDAVFLAGLVEGTLPIIYAEKSPEQIEEERRLLYVGVTRAREFLTLSWALARSPGGRKSRRRSRFLDGVAPRSSGPPRIDRSKRRAAALGPQPCRVCERPLTAAVERKLGRCETCPADFDEALLARMRDWRADTSKEQKVPAYVVFTDATLQAIAERAPTSEAELAVIPGVGAVKLDRYGGAVLALCRGDELVD